MNTLNEAGKAAGQAAALPAVGYLPESVLVHAAVAALLRGDIDGFRNGLDTLALIDPAWRGTPWPEPDAAPAAADVLALPTVARPGAVPANDAHGWPLLEGGRP